MWGHYSQLLKGKASTAVATSVACFQCWLLPPLSFLQNPGKALPSVAALLRIGQHKLVNNFQRQCGSLVQMNFAGTLDFMTESRI